MSVDSTSAASIGVAGEVLFWAWTTFAAIVFGAVVTGLARSARDKWWRQFQLRWIAGDYDEFLATGVPGDLGQKTGVTISVRHQGGYRFSAHQHKPGAANEWTSSFVFDPLTRRGSGVYSYPDGLEIDWGNQELSFMTDDRTVCAIDTNVAVGARTVLVWRKRQAQ